MTDPELDRALIDAARESMGPSEAQQKRLLERTLLAVGGAVASGAVTSGAAAAAATGAGVAGGAAAGGAAAGGGVIVAGATVATWKIAVLAVAGLAVVGGTAWRVSQDPDEAPVAETPAEARPNAGAEVPVEAAVRSGHPTAESVPPAAAALPVDEVAADLPPAEVATPVQRANARPTTPRDVPAPSAQATLEQPPAPAGQLGAEAALVRSAHRALQSGQPLEALRLLDEHRATFPTGALSQERTATRVLALCEAGRTPEATQVADGFLRRHPDSMQAARIRASCAGSE